MLRYILTVLLLVTTCFAQDQSRMDSLVQYYLSDGQFMGSVLVARGDQVLFSKSYGSANLEWNVPNTPATKFRLGSITKQFTAAAVLLLEEQGKLNIQDPIKKYLADSPPAWDQITIYQVLTHTSGIPSITNSSEYSKLEVLPLTPSQNIDKIRDQPLEFKPGSQFKYSNSGYILLGYLVEKVSGQSYQDFLQKNIFTPLGMKDSGCDSNSAIIPRRASGYSPGQEGPQNAGFVHMSVPFSAGALFSTTEDLLRWEQGLFGGKLLSAASLAKMTTPFKSNYALGLAMSTVNGRKQISHGGGIEGFNTYLAYFPDTKLTVAVLANLNGNAPQQIADKLAAIAFGDTVVLPSEKKVIVLSTEILKQYVGVYDLGQMAPNYKMMIALENGQLTAQSSGGSKTPLFASSETKFSPKVVDDEFEFEKDDKGAVTGFILHQQSGGRITKAPRLSAEVPQHKEITLPPTVLDQYVGTYKLAPGTDMTITIEGTQLFIQLTGQPKFPIFPESDTKFFLKVVDATCEFLKDNKGVVTDMVLRQGITEVKAPLISAKKELSAFDGTWTSSVKGPDGNSMEVTYVFEALGKTLIGTVSTSLGGGPFSEGKIEGNNISFVVRTDQFTIVTTGTLSGDAISFTQKNGGEVVQFIAKRVDRKPDMK
jgi:CubicO group peptidase (beta-lactamase class C family)